MISRQKLNRELGGILLNNEEYEMEALKWELKQLQKRETYLKGAIWVAKQAYLDTIIEEIREEGTC